LGDADRHRPDTPLSNWWWLCATVTGATVRDACDIPHTRPHPLRQPPHTVALMPRQTFDPRAALDHLARGGRREHLVHVRQLPRREAELLPWPTWVDPGVYAAWSGAGVTHLWSHQREMAE